MPFILGGGYFLRFFLEKYFFKTIDILAMS